MSKVIRTCKCCHDPFTARQADVARGWAIYCSKSCKAKVQESRTGQHADFLARKQARNHDYASSDQGWGEHEIWSKS